MALTADEAARLARLKAARDKLISGEAIAEIRNADGAAKKTHQGSVDALKEDIEALEAKAVSTTGARRRGAVSFRL